MNFDDPVIDWRTRGFLHPEPITRTDFLAARHSLFDGPFTWPLLVLRQSALNHNIATLARFATDHGLTFAPHGKTTMSPELVQAQLRAGAWGMTAANAAQVLAFRHFGVRRVLLANEIYDVGALHWLAGELEAGFECLVYADCPEGVSALSAAAGNKPFQVLIELGQPNARTGCRGLKELRTLTEMITNTEGVELAGVAGYEGTQPGPDEVRAYLRQLAEAAELVRPYTKHLIVSAGGSAWFDLVAEELGIEDATVILRSGAYIAHDEGLYARASPLRDVLQPAIEVWAQVISTPEPGLIMVGMGKRDVPYDIDLPIPHNMPAGITVERIQDQHTYLSGDGLRPGDLVSFGISHPCTAFDKWRVIPVVDDDHVVVDLITTYF
ncbi:alanine racemase [Acrocarpospora macrocephala]|uniref:Amino acid deaminase n=1 Tax=Acrocarpospora macrocephala TaxID=150177 RepID=A0A5M3X724_9ACTN|nr:alanine racemase [Acrocarpospora macrocephala]GES16880.1 amino acid deaminase [Acrocarpospora macrocephala]